MKTQSGGDPPKIDPKAEEQRTQRLQQLLAQQDTAVAQLQAARDHQKALQDALSQLQGELNQTQPKLVPAQQDAATKRAAADALKPRIDELRAALDVATARLLGSIDTKVPILLLPLRLETRFMQQSPSGPTELLVRLYPDDIHIDTHEPALTADEQSWGNYFQAQAKPPAGASEDMRKGAWRQLVGRFGIKRAAWIARVVDPDHPLSVGSRNRAWTRAPYSKVLPDRWVAVAFRGDQPAVTVWGKPIQDPLATGPSPTASSGAAPAGDATLPAVDDGMRWMIDFKAAEDAGMGLRLPLSDEQAAHGFERLLVIGVRSSDAADGAQRLVELFAAHHYTNGLSLLPQSTPTNNTEAPSGYGLADRDAEIAYTTELGNALIGPLPSQAGDWLDGHWLAWALGIPSSSLEHVRYADGTEQRDARETNKQLWPHQDTPWLRRLLVDGGSGGISQFVSGHFSTYVVARGPLPALRVGNEPYGVLPVTSFDQTTRRPRPDVEARFLRRLRELQHIWLRCGAAAPTITRGDELDTLMAQSGNSCSYVIQDFQKGAPQPPVGIAPADLLAKWFPAVNQSLAVESLDACSHRFDAWVTSLATKRLDDLRQANPSGIRLGGYGWLEDVRPASKWQPATPPAGVTGPVFQSANNMGFLQAPSIAQAATAAILRSGYMSHLQEGQGNPFAVDLSSDRVRRADWLLQGVGQGQSLGALLGYRFERRLHESGLDQYIARFRTLTGIKENDELANDYARVQAAEKLCKAVQALRDEAAHAAACAASWHGKGDALKQTRQQFQNVISSYESLQNQKIPAAAQATAAALAAASEHKATNPQSVLHNKTVKNGGSGKNVVITDSVDLVQESDVADWATKQKQLESVYQQAKADEAALRKELADAKRDYDIAVQQAAQLDDPTNPQSIPAAKAAEDQQTQFADAFDQQATTLEGKRGNAEQDLAAARLTLAQAINQQWQKSLESVAANNVVDGLELRRRWRAAKDSTQVRWDATTIPFGDASLGFPAPTAGDFNLLSVQLQWLDEMVDAVGDLVLAESAYHLVQGNPLRSGASLDAIAGGGTPPPELEVIRTPRTGTGLTHRLVVLFSTPPSPAAPAWPLDANQVRASAEPLLNAWAALLLPDPSKVHCRVEFVDRRTRNVVGSADVLLTALQLSPLDVVYMTHSRQGPQRAELEERLISHVGKAQTIPPNADIRLGYDRDPKSPPDTFSFGELVEVAQTVRALFAGSRAIDGRDLASPGENADLGLDLTDLSNRATAAQQSFAKVLTTLQVALATVRSSAAANLDALSSALLQASAFGVAGAVPSSTSADATEARADLLAQGDSVAKEMDGRLQRIAQLALPAGATPEAQRVYELARMRELFGPDFQIVYWITPQNASALKQSLASTISLQGFDALQSITWFQRVACIREGVARLHAALQYAEALGTGAKLALLVGQLPYHDGDRWAALSGAIRPGLLSLVVHSALAQTPSLDQPVAGLLIDEWNEIVPKSSEVTGLTFHFDQPNAYAPQTMLLAVAPDDRPMWDLDTLGATLLDTLNLARTRALVADGRAEVAWCEGKLPRGAQPAGESDGWQWITHDPAPLTSGPVHTSPVLPGAHQHFFSGATDTLTVSVGDMLFAYVHLDLGNPPREVMLQWNDGTWEHRAYWGQDRVQEGQDNTVSRQQIGGLPPLGQWVRLEVPAAAVGLETREINGMAFTLFDGRAAWDSAGKIPAQALSADSADQHHETVWFEEQLPPGATPAADSDSWQWVSRDPTPKDGSFIHQSSVAPTIHQHYFLVPGETIWVGGQLPAGAVPHSDGAGETWQWVNQNPTPQFGSPVHQSALLAGMHQHDFDNATATMRVATGDSFFAYVYLDPNIAPREVMLQWYDGSWEHRAYWGENLLAWGTDGTASRYFMGPLPLPGQWVRLEVPARLVALEGRDLSGMAFTLFDGRATWDRSGKCSQLGTLRVAKGDTLYADVYLDPANPPAEVMLQWNDGSWEHRAYWSANTPSAGADASASRRFMGSLPALGQWVRLEVPASSVGLDGREVVGIAFTLSSGRASWNRAGLLSAPVVPALLNVPGVT
jgi:hypothetical protein